MDSLRFSDEALALCTDIADGVIAKKTWKDAFHSLPRDQQALVCAWWLLRHEKHTNLDATGLERVLGDVTAYQNKFVMPMNKRSVLAQELIAMGLFTLHNSPETRLRLPSAAEAQLLGFDEPPHLAGGSFTSADVVLAGIELARIHKILSKQSRKLLALALLNAAKPR